MKLILLLCVQVWANWQGEVHLEGRRFLKSDGNDTFDSQNSVTTRLEGTGEKFEIKYQLRGLARVDESDTARDQIYFEDFWLSKSFSFGRFDVGYKVYNWSVMETFHPNDTINSRNYDGDLESLDKLGMPTFSYRLPLFDGELEAHIFPLLVEPIYPSHKSRLGYGIALEKPLWVDNNGEFVRNEQAFQYALRYNFLWKNLEGDVHFLRHYDTSRPLVSISVFSPTNILFTPHYFEVLRYGFTLVASFEDTLVKAEGSYLDFLADGESFALFTAYGQRFPVDYSILALGVEHSFNKGPHDFVLFAEFQRIWDLEFATRTEREIFQSDLSIGGRMNFNDLQNKQISTVMVFDLERSREIMINLKYEQRLTEEWKSSVALRYIDAPSKSRNIADVRGLNAYDQDHQVSLRVSRFF